LFFIVIKYFCCLMRRHVARHSQDTDSRLPPAGFSSVTLLSFRPNSCTLGWFKSLKGDGPNIESLQARNVLVSQFQYVYFCFLMVT
jgi:hypothetical protein